MKPFSSAVPLAAAIGLLASCASQTAQVREPVETFVEADYQAAVVDLERRLEGLPPGQTDHLLSLQLALALAVPGQPARDEQRARELLDELTASSEVAGEAKAVLQLLDAIHLAETELAATRPQLDRLVEVQSAFVELVSACSEETSTLARDIASRDTRIQELERRLDAIEIEAGRLAHELEQLKQIDLDVGE